jgi:hypothetical protein
MAGRKIYKAPDYARFVYARASNSQYSFSTYTDSVGALGTPGKVVFISYRLDKKNQPEPYQFGFSMRDRNIRVEENRTDAQGYNVAEFLRAHPECKGSPNGYYKINEDGTEEQVAESIFFKEVNEEADAKKLLEATEYRRKAENLAANLTYEEVLELNSYFGVFKQTEELARVALNDIAGNKPAIFMEAYEDPKRKAVAAVRRGIDKRVLKVSGTVVIWNKTTIGIDELDAAANLQRDPKLLEALETAIKKVG